MVRHSGEGSSNRHISEWPRADTNNFPSTEALRDRGWPFRREPYSAHIGSRSAAGFPLRGAVSESGVIGQRNATLAGNPQCTLDSFQTAVTIDVAMREQVIQVVEKYIDAVRRNRRFGR